LEGELADLEEPLHAGLAASQLLHEAGWLLDQAVGGLAVLAEPLNQLLDLLDRERLGQIVVRAVAQTEDGRVDRGHTRHQDHRGAGLLAFDGSQQVEPAQPGILMSETTRSNTVSESNSSACSALAAVETRQLCVLRAEETNCSTWALSST